MGNLVNDAGDNSVNGKDVFILWMIYTTRIYVPQRWLPDYSLSRNIDFNGILDSLAWIRKWNHLYSLARTREEVYTYLLQEWNFLHNSQEATECNIAPSKETVS